MKETKTTDTKTTVMLILMLLYVISPIDLMPGLPFDDAVVVILWYLQYKTNGTTKKNPQLEDFIKNNKLVDEYENNGEV